MKLTKEVAEQIFDEMSDNCKNPSSVYIVRILMRRFGLTLSEANNTRKKYFSVLATGPNNQIINITAIDYEQWEEPC